MFLLPDDSASSPLIRYIILLVTLIATIIIYKRIRQYLAYLTYQRQTGCLPAPRYPQSPFLFGLDIYQRRMRGLLVGNSSALYAADFRTVGKTFQESILGKTVISTMDARNHAHIYSNGFDQFGKNTARARFAAPVIGVGIFLAEGAHWKRSRAMVRPMFARAELADLRLAEKHIGRFLGLLPRDGRAFDIQEMLKRLFLDMTTKTLLGESIDSQLVKGKKAADEFNKAWDETLLGLQKRRRPGMLAFYSLFDRNWPKSYRYLHAFFDRYVHEALDRKRASSEKNTEKGDKDKDEAEQTPSSSSQRYFLLDELAQHISDPIALRFELINIFLASRDTTAILSANVFFQLARHPEWFDKLREEALTVLRPSHKNNNNNNLSSSSSSSSPLFPTITLDIIRNLSTFRAVINETLRTLGPSGRSQRLALTDTTLPTGGGPDGNSPIFVPRGTAVCSLVRNLHRDRDVWGEDADEFRPERWEGGKKVVGPWEFVPFLGGPRSCPAQQQVMIQVTYLLLRVVLGGWKGVRNEDATGGEYVERQGMVVESRNGVWISLVV